MSTDCTDHIGDRLDRPELVPYEYRHLIADDKARVERILSFPLAGRVLDVGASDRAISDRLVDRWRVELVAVDVDVRVSNVIQWDVREPPQWLDGPFDAALATEFFEHLTEEDSEIALRNICAVLKPEGDLIVTVPNKACADHYVAGCRDRWKWPDHKQAFDAEKLRRFLQPHFRQISEVPLYDGENWQESIFLIVRARGRK
jgi:2-polyprenyl-3-methyl-5-hydroxy-6-metoxy-1,4-benzoquinol methylase